MKKYLIFLPLFCLFTKVSSQSLLDHEIKQLVKELTSEVSQKMKGENIAITDFLGSDDQPSELGNYLAEEFSYALVNTASSDFKVVDRSQLRKLLNEAGIGDKGLVDAQSVQKLGRLKGISAVVYGKLMPVGNNVRIFAKVIILEEMVNEINVRGDITRTPTIEGLLGAERKTLNNVGATQSKDGKTSATATSLPFINQNMQVVLAGCAYKGGGTVDCELQITSLGRDDNFSMQTAGTVLIDPQGQSYRAQSMTMNNRTSTVQVNYSLRQDTPAPAVVRFTRVPAEVKIFSQLNINCRSFSAYDFIARFTNISIY